MFSFAGLKPRFFALWMMVLTSLTVAPALGADIPKIEDFYTGNKSATYLKITFIDEKQEEELIFIQPGITGPQIEALMVFENDVCYDKFIHSQGSGNFSFECKSGATLQAAFTCRTGNCPIRGKHSSRGSFLFVHNDSNDKLELAEILAFNGSEPAEDSVVTTSLTAALEVQITEEVAPVTAAQPASNASVTEVANVTQSEQNQPVQKVASVETTTQQATTQQATTQAVTVATSPAASTLSVSTSSSQWRNARDAAEAQLFIDDIQASIAMFMAIADVINQQPVVSKERVLSVVGEEIERLRNEKTLLQQQLSSRFSTPIRPTNANLTVSAFRAADTFPKIPFYVPGTNEIGEMLVIPRVSDEGYLNYQLDFLDPTSTYNKVRDSIDIAHEDIQLVIYGLHKVDEWTKVAQQNNVNRRIEKTASCIPEGLCDEKKQGISSTEIVFQIYEDGSTAGRIQRNKGKFSVGYNLSVESSVLLSAYLIYMKDVGAKEFNIGVMSDQEVIDLFQ